MVERRVAHLVISIVSITLWDLLLYFNLISGKIQTGLILISLLFFVHSFYNLSIDYKIESKYFKFFFSLFMFYQFITVIRGWEFSYNEMKSYFQAGFILWPFVIPLFVFFDKRLSTIGYLIKWLYYAGVFFLIIFIIYPPFLLNRVTAETLVSTIYGCGFILLIARYIRDKRVTITFVLISISLLSLVYVARRNGVVTLSGFILVGYFLNIWNKSRTFIYRFFPLLAACVIFLMISLTTFTSTLSSKLQTRITQDTRSTLFRNFFIEMKDYMIIGKGMNGEYYFPMQEQVMEDVTETAVVYRRIIENGYLQLLLTGGIVHIVLFVLILLPASLLGMFQSSNQFTKACGAAIFLWILDMLIYGLPRLSLHYILVWICVGICYKQTMRSMTNSEIESEFEKVKLI